MNINELQVKIFFIKFQWKAAVSVPGIFNRKKFTEVSKYDVNICKVQSFGPRELILNRVSEKFKKAANFKIECPFRPVKIPLLPIIFHISKVNLDDVFFNLSQNS